MSLWSWAWHEGQVAAILQPAIAPLGTGPTYMGLGPYGQLLPYAQPVVMTIVWVLRCYDCSVRAVAQGPHQALQLLWGADVTCRSASQPNVARGLFCLWLHRAT